MSLNQDRHFAAGSAALTAARAAGGRRLNRHHASALHTGMRVLPPNVRELNPGTAEGRNVACARRRLLGSEAGMATAEYAIATLAAVGFAGLLVFILRSEEVRGFLLTLIRTALALP